MVSASWLDGKHRNRLYWRLISNHTRLNNHLIVMQCAQGFLDHTQISLYASPTYDGSKISWIGAWNPDRVKKISLESEFKIKNLKNSYGRLWLGYITIWTIITITTLITIIAINGDNGLKGFKKVLSFWKITITLYNRLLDQRLLLKSQWLVMVLTILTI